jgi:hypothetical protein
MLALRKTDPAAAVEGLRRSARGLEYLLERWEYLAGQLSGNGSWSTDEAFEAQVLSGCPHEGRSGPEAFDAWYIQYHSALCRYGPDDRRTRFYLEPLRCPASNRECIEGFGPPDRDEALSRLTSVTDSAIKDVRARLETARSIAEAERSNARVRALTLRDDREARLMIRYQSEARLAFHRAWDALRKSLKEEARDGYENVDLTDEGQPALTEPVAPEEAPEPAGAAPAKVEPRNEPNFGAKLDVNKPSAPEKPPLRPAAPAPKGERLLDSMFVDPFLPAGGVDVIPIKVVKGAEGPRKG